jgi:hypothetical protein
MVAHGGGNMHGNEGGEGQVERLVQGRQSLP